MMAPHPPTRTLIAAAFLAAFLALAVGAAYHLVEARTRADPALADLARGPLESLQELGLVLPDAPARYADYAFADAAGKVRRLSEFDGKVVLLDFWASWCAPCLERLPALDRLAARLPSDHFAVLAIAVDQGGAQAVRRAYADAGVRKLEIFTDAGARALATIGLSGIPTALILGSDGFELGRMPGIRPWDEAALTAFLARLLAEVPAARAGAEAS